MNNSAFIAIDGNQIGKKIEKMIFLNDLEGLADFSVNITQVISDLAVTIGRYGSIYLSGGDNILAEVDREKMTELLEQIKDISGTGWEYSTGIGASALDAYLALKCAKVSKEKIVEYSDNRFITGEIHIEGDKAGI